MCNLRFGTFAISELMETTQHLLGQTLVNNYINLHQRACVYAYTHTHTHTLTLTSTHAHIHTLRHISNA